jgi:hypothetical protein
MRYLLGIFLVASTAWAQSPLAPCVTLQWDYPEHPNLGSFFVYVKQNGRYAIDPDHNPLKSQPTTTIEALPVMDTDVSCAALKLSGPGPWSLVVTAVARDMSDESDPSDELVVHRDLPLPPSLPPKTLPPLSIPRVGPLPKPLPLAQHPPVTVPPLSTSPGRDPYDLTQTDVWKGQGSSAVLPAPVRQAPGAPASGSGSLTDTCVWRGVPCD